MANMFNQSLLNEKIKNKIITVSDYSFESDHDMTIKLSDQVVLYNSGDGWKIVPLLLAVSYPIIYDKYKFDDKIYDITIAACPLSLRATVFKGIFEFETYQNDIMILKESATTNLLPIDSGYKIDKKYVIENNKRSEVKITTLRNAIIMAPDAKYMILSKKLVKKIDPIVGTDYYSNMLDYTGKELNALIHPKTLVYVVQYKSFVDEDEKVTILLGKDSSKTEVTGFDFRKSKIMEYLSKHHTKIINREGYIIPCLWNVAKTCYADAKIVYMD